jgi:hypothetical protein
MVGEVLLLLSHVDIVTKVFIVWTLMSHLLNIHFTHFAMLEISNKYFVCYVKFHPDWWASWEYNQKLDEELIELAKQMKLEQTQEEIMRKTKEATTFGLDLKIEGTYIYYPS